MTTAGERGCVKKYCLEEGVIEGNEIKNTLVLTFGFQLVFTAFIALQNLHSSLHDEENLGLVCLSVLYGTGIVSSMFAPTIIGRFGTKRVLLAAFSSHCLYILANLYSSWETMIPAAVVVGAFHGPAWTCQGLYISACAFSFSKTSSSSPFAVLSRFNNLFFAVFATCQIFGNLATSLLIRDGVGNTSDITIFKYCGPRDCPANENATEMEDPDPVVVDVMLGFFMACSVSGLLLVTFLLTPLPKSDWSRQVDIRKATASFVNVLSSTDMLLLVPFIMFTAIEHAFLLGSFTKSYVSCPIGIHMVGFVMSSYGAVTPIFFFLFTRIARVAGRLLLLLLSAFIHLILLTILLIWEPKHDDETLIFILPMIWGVAESILQAQANGLIAMLFPNQKEPAFANFHAWRSLGYCITFLNVAYMCVSVKLIICMVCLVVGTVLYVYVEVKHKVKEKTSLNQKPRPSIVSDEGDANQVHGPNDGHSIHVALRKKTSCLSEQDRRSYDRFELTDIIKDAELNWSRQEGSLTLHVERAMSEEHLRESKVTTLFHTCSSPSIAIVSSPWHLYSCERIREEVDMETGEIRAQRPAVPEDTMTSLCPADTPVSRSPSTPTRRGRLHRGNNSLSRRYHQQEVSSSANRTNDVIGSAPVGGRRLLNGHTHDVTNGGKMQYHENRTLSSRHLDNRNSERKVKKNPKRGSRSKEVLSVKYTVHKRSMSDPDVEVEGTDNHGYSSDAHPDSIQVTALNQNAIDLNGNPSTHRGLTTRYTQNTPHESTVSSTEHAKTDFETEKNKNKKNKNKKRLFLSIPFPHFSSHRGEWEGGRVSDTSSPGGGIEGVYRSKSSIANHNHNSNIDSHRPVGQKGIDANIEIIVDDLDRDSDGFVQSSDDDDDYDDDIDGELEDRYNNNNMDDISAFKRRKRKRSVPVVASEDVSCIY